MYVLVTKPIFMFKITKPSEITSPVSVKIHRTVDTSLNDRPSTNVKSMEAVSVCSNQPITTYQLHFKLTFPILLHGCYSTICGTYHLLLRTCMWTKRLFIVQPYRESLWPNKEEISCNLLRLRSNTNVDGIYMSGIFYDKTFKHSIYHNTFIGSYIHRSKTHHIANATISIARLSEC